MSESFGEAGPETAEEYAHLLGRLPERRLAREAPNGFVIRCDILSFRLLFNHPERRNDVGGTFAPEACWFTHYNYAPFDSIHIIDNGTDNGGPERARREAVLGVLDAHAGEPLELVAFFCHGWPVGMQFGFRLDSLPDLVAALAAKGAPGIRIVLYACETGASPEEGELEVLRRDRAHPATPETEEEEAANDRREAALRATIAGQAAGIGGFAFTLRDQLVATHPGCQVFAHVTLGHSTHNPELRRFSGPAGSPGEPVVPHAPRPRRHEDEAAQAARAAARTLWTRWQQTLADPFSTTRPSSLVWRFPLMTNEEIAAYLDDLYSDHEAAP